MSRDEALLPIIEDVDDLPSYVTYTINGTVFWLNLDSNSTVFWCFAKLEMARRFLAHLTRVPYDTIMAHISRAWRQAPDELKIYLKRNVSYHHNRIRQVYHYTRHHPNCCRHCVYHERRTDGEPDIIFPNYPYSAYTVYAIEQHGGSPLEAEPHWYRLDPSQHARYEKLAELENKRHIERVIATEPCRRCRECNRPIRSAAR